MRRAADPSPAMNLANPRFESLAKKFASKKGVAPGLLFGVRCLKADGKPFVAGHGEDVVFKLHDEAHAKALAVKGARLWDPSGANRPMREWVAVPAAEKYNEEALALSALGYVQSGK